MTMHTLDEIGCCSKFYAFDWLRDRATPIAMHKYAPIQQDDSIATSSCKHLDKPQGKVRLKKIAFYTLIVVPYLLLAIYGITNNTQSTCQRLDLARVHDKNSKNLHADAPLVSHGQRFQTLGQKGATFWFTGLSGSGKSTITKKLESALLKIGIRVYRLDGDNLRLGISRDLGFSEFDRKENIRRAGDISVLLTDSGAITLVSLISPFKADREALRELHRQKGLLFYEVFVDVDLSVAISRDPKGLYELAMRGKIQQFTGISSPYEAPDKPDIHLETAKISLEDEVRTLENFMRAKGLFIGEEHVPVGYPGIALADGSDNFTQKYQQRSDAQTVMARYPDWDTLPRVLIRDEDIHWLQVLGEGWASPLKGFMREGAYLQCLYFSSIIQKQQDDDNEGLTSTALNITSQSLANTKRISLSVPIVLPVDTITKNRIGSAKHVVLLSPSGEEVAVLRDPDIYPHRKQERITRTFGTMDLGHPYVKKILASGDYLLGGDIELLHRLRYNDGLDQYRLTPDELRQKFEAMNADIVVAFQTRNPTHAGHAYLMNTARRDLLRQGYKNPILWLSPLGGWTKADDVPLDVRIRQHEAVLQSGVLDDKSTVLAIWPSPMIYAGPREVVWHAKSRRNAGARAFIVGRDPAGIKHSSQHDDLYQGNHGRYVLQTAPGLEELHLMSFEKVFYDTKDQQMKPMEISRKNDFLSISGTRMRQMARQGLDICSDTFIPKQWTDKATCVPSGFMDPAGWKILVDYYQHPSSPGYIPYSMHLQVPNIASNQSITTEGTYGRLDFKLFYTNDKGDKISPWHDVPLVPLQSASNVYNFIVEIPKGVTYKMEINKQQSHNPIMQDREGSSLQGRVFRYGVPFFNYGAFPQTWENPEIADSLGHKGDNDPLDVIEIGTATQPMGSVSMVKVLGSLSLIDQGEIDHKIIVISIHDTEADSIHSIEDVDRFKPGLITKIIDWLRYYKTAEGKPENTFAKKQPFSVDEAIKIIRATHNEWKALVEGSITTNSSFFLK